MPSTLKIALDIAENIRTENIAGKVRIPSSDTHLRIWASNYIKSEDDIRKILINLKDAHYIFLVHTVAPDPNLFVYGEESYVFADYSILNELKKVTEEQLEKIYEATQYKRKSAFQITRELFPKIKDYNNTPLGRAINLSVMMEEYQRLVNAQSFEFTDQWRRTKIQELFKDDAASSADMAAALNFSKQEEVEIESHAEVSKEKEDPVWQRVTQEFPVEFLLRIHFKKYEFDVIKKLIQTGRVKEEKYLKMIRDTLETLEKKSEKDRILQMHKDTIIDLRRYSQAKLNMARQGIFRN